MAPWRMHEEELELDEPLVQHLISTQMPDLADRPLRRVEPWGTDNAIWRLGEDLVVRLPRIHWAAGQPEKEATWLPFLVPRLPVALPLPVALGEPDTSYPYRWAVHRWLPGEGADLSLIDDPVQFALDVASVVQALWALPIEGAPTALNRAGPIADYNTAALWAIDAASELVDAAAARAIWEEALAAPPHEGAPLWVHGDIEGNCLVGEGRLSGIVDWSSACAGDPAVDVQVVWSPLFTEESRAAFIDELGIDEATLARSRGAAVQQACAALPYYLHSYPQIVERSWHKLTLLGVQPSNASR